MKETISFMRLNGVEIKIPEKVMVVEKDNYFILKDVLPEEEKK